MKLRSLSTSRNSTTVLKYRIVILPKLTYLYRQPNNEEILHRIGKVIHIMLQTIYIFIILVNICKLVRSQ
jgi:hypothetical protein